MTMSRTLVIGCIISAALAPAATYAQEREGLLRGNFWTGPEQVRIDGDARAELKAERKEARVEVRTEARAELSAEKREDLLRRLEDRMQHLRRVADGEGKPFPAIANFKARLEAEAGTTSVRAAIKAKPELRAMAVALPKAALIAMSDRALTIAAQMEAFGAKLDARIDAAADAGADVDEARAAYGRYMDAVRDAEMSAEAAADIAADLEAGEEGAQALAEARAEIREAHSLLKDARAEIAAILSSIRAELKAEAR